MSSASPFPDPLITRVHIDSKHRLNPATDNSSRFLFEFNREVKEIARVRIESVQIPFTYYVITAANNSITTSNGVVTIPAGNYTAISVSAALKTALDTLAGAPYTVLYSSTTHKLTISAAGAFSITVSTDAATIGAAIGFTVDSAANTTHTGDSVINLSGTKYILIKSIALTKFAKNPSVSAPNSALAPNLDGKNILHSTPSTVTPSNVIIDDPFTTGLTLNHPITLKTIDLRIENDLGNLLDLNGANWAMQLLFYIG